jgi:hypothetical protein
MESGSADLLRFLRKPGTPQDVIAAVAALKRGGVAVGIIVLLGAGGLQHAQKHIRDTVTAINAMPLDGDDIIYFSVLFAPESVPYASDAARAGITPLSPDECLAQGDQIESGLRFRTGNDTPRISRYDIREFIY